MIEIKNKVDCCGCKACGDICPKDAVKFKLDSEGFWYPEVDKNICIECGLCEKVCPVLHPDFSNIGNSNDPISYILQAPSTFDRLQSASGAAYTLLVKEFFAMGGYVAGHIWKDKANVIGYVSGNPKDLEKLRSTKYLQSDIEGLYQSVKKLLVEGKYVLFSGCPCQIAAMRLYLRKDYDKLITTDFTCMGIDSPFAFGKYLESLERIYKSNIVYFKAKAKDVGWRHLTNKVVFANGKSYFGINGKDSNLKATFLHVLVRPSCYDCKFKGFPRISDITIGDYWRKSSSYDPLDDNTGTSYAILHNKKAIRFFDKIKPSCNYRQCKLTEIVDANTFALNSLPHPTFNREEFYKRLNDEDFSEVVEEYYKEKYKIGKLTVHNIWLAIRALLKGVYINKAYPISVIRFLYYNIFSKKVKTNLLNGDVLFLKNTQVKLCSGAQLVIKGRCFIGDSGANTIISIGKKSKLMLDSNRIEAGSKFFLVTGSNVCIGFKSVVGNNVLVKSQSSINIGEFSLVQDGVCINDLDNGVVYFNTDCFTDKSVDIGAHVLIGKGAIINGSTHIGDDSIVKEYSVVKGIFQHSVTLAGNPAKEINNNIKWKFNF